MIIGIGNDLIEIDRIRKVCEKEAFLLRYYTEAERKCCRNASMLAGNFAVKEAVAKALGTGFSKFFPNEIEVLREETGKPYVNLYHIAKEIAEEQKVKRIFVTISNTDSLAMACAVLEGESL